MRYLIFGGPGIGDTIIELSMAKALKENDNDAMVDLLISNSLGSANSISEILKYQIYVDHLFVWSKRDILSMFITFSKMKQRKYDYGFSCATSFKANDTPAKVCRLLGCTSIIKEVNKKTGKIDIPILVDENLHIVEQCQEVIRKLYPNCKLDLYVLCKEKIPTKKIERLNKLVTICIGTNITTFQKDKVFYEKNIKQWDIQNWIKVANYLSSKSYSVALIGGKKEKEFIDDLRSTIDDQVGVYVGITSIEESLSIIKQSDLVVGADTGMMHCAAALNKKTITLFGGTDSRVWRPFSIKGKVIEGKSDCRPCYGLDRAITCTSRKCMESISVQNVIDTIICALQENEGD